jgi:hypothetical protein
MTNSSHHQQDLVTKTGYVFFMKFAEGSKSESLRPFLVTPTETLRLHADGDNPFVNESLGSYHRAFCAVGGVLAENRLLKVRTITRLNDPFGGNTEDSPCSEGKH